MPAPYSYDLRRKALAVMKNGDRNALAKLKLAGKRIQLTSCQFLSALESQLTLALKTNSGFSDS